MKTLACLTFAMAPTLFTSAQEKPAAPAAPVVNVISTHRLTVKEGHEAAFKAALAAHARRFHQGDWAWRVGSVLSGPEGRTYQIVEGPFSWTALDARPDPGAAQTRDYEANLAPQVEKTTPDTYAIYETGMSNVGATPWTDKVLIVRYTVKPGQGMLAAEILKAYRAANIKRGFSFVVWHSIYSGDSVYFLVYRFKDGWKEFDLERPGIKDAFDEIGGPGEYARQQAKVAAAFESITSELVENKPELGSK